MGKVIDMTDKRIGSLVVIERNGVQNGKAMWLCKCDCGNHKTVSGDNLRNGHTRSCGCLWEKAIRPTRIKHGKAQTRLYRTWCHFKDRCCNDKDKRYPRYGGRGIQVCEEWKNDFQAFYDWAMANGYKDHLTIDRIDNDGNYEPGNCRWVTNKTQSNNRQTNVLIEFEGKRQNIKQWSEELQMNYQTIYQRHRKGMAPEEILSKKEVVNG